jgi:hypothetical protein
MRPQSAFRDKAAIANARHGCNLTTADINAQLAKNQSLLLRISRIIARRRHRAGVSVGVTIATWFIGSG